MFLLSPISTVMAGSMKITSNEVVFSDGSSQTTSATAGSGQWSVNSSDLYYNSGNVGIGTATPSEKLSLSGGSFVQNPGNPKHVGSITDDVTTGLNTAYGIYVLGKYAYVTSDEDAVEILDISNPINPTHVGVIFKDAGNALLGPLDIHVSGQYAYVASVGNNGVEIIDVSNPSNPTHVSFIVSDGSNGLRDISSIFVSGKYVYAVSYTDDSMVVIDVSDPANPAISGSITDTDDTALKLEGAKGIYVAGKYAYVASQDEDAVEILDISDPTNPTHVGAIVNGSTPALKLNRPKAIIVSGKYAYVASSADSSVEILDISNPASPTHVGAITDNGETALLGVNDIYVAGKYAYAISEQENGVEILDISDPANPVHAGAIFDDAITTLADPFSIFVSGKHAYVTSATEHGVEILDISGIDTPGATIGSVSAGSIQVSDNMLVGNDLQVENNLNVGPGGLHVTKGKGLTVGDYTMLGSDAPKIKIKKFTGTLDTDSTTIHTHSISVEKILSAVTLVNVDVNYFPPEFTAFANAKYSFYISNYDFMFVGVDANLQGKPYKITVMYEE